MWLTPSKNGNGLTILYGNNEKTTKWVFMDGQKQRQIG